MQQYSLTLNSFKMTTSHYSLHPKLIYICIHFFLDIVFNFQGIQKTTTFPNYFVHLTWLLSVIHGGATLVPGKWSWAIGNGNGMPPSNCY